jgi:hypothetical protein
MTDDKTREAEAGESRSPEEIQADIESTREELGDTVEELAAKTDVKEQARKQADAVKVQAQEKVAEAKRKLTAAKDEMVRKAQETSPETRRYVAGAAFVGFLVGQWSKR